MNRTDALNGIHLGLVAPLVPLIPEARPGTVGDQPIRLVRMLERTAMTMLLTGYRARFAAERRAERADGGLRAMWGWECLASGPRVTPHARTRGIAGGKGVQGGSQKMMNTAQAKAGLATPSGPPWG